MRMTWMGCLLAAWLVAACGGGGGGGTTTADAGSGAGTGAGTGSTGGTGGTGTGGGGTGAGTGTGTGTGTATQLTWEAAAPVADRAALLAQLNAQGARGFAYFSSMVFGGSEFTNLYVRDGSGPLTYEILDTAADATSLQAQLDAQGARGFDFYGPTTAGTIYARRGAGTFSYRLLPVQSTNAGLLAQANAQGAQGAYYAGSLAFSGSTAAVSIYVLVNGTTARYAYSLEPTASDPGTPETFVAQADAKGRDGWRFVSGQVFPGEPLGDPLRSRNLYVRDTSQSATFTWQTLEMPATAAAFVAQANAQGAAGSSAWGSYVFFPGGSAAGGGFVARNLYFTATGCSGPLCTSTSPL